MSKLVLHKELWKARPQTLHVFIIIRLLTTDVRSACSTQSVKTNNMCLNPDHRKCEQMEAFDSRLPGFSGNRWYSIFCGHLLSNCKNFPKRSGKYKHVSTVEYCFSDYYYEEHRTKQTQRLHLLGKAECLSSSYKADRKKQTSLVFCENIHRGEGRNEWFNLLSSAQQTVVQLHSVIIIAIIRSESYFTNSGRGDDSLSNDINAPIKGRRVQ